MIPCCAKKSYVDCSSHHADLKRLGVEHLCPFGSTARDEAMEDSDVDLFF